MARSKAASADDLLTQALERSEDLFDAEPASHQYAQRLDRLSSVINAFVATGKRTGPILKSSIAETIFQFASVLWVRPRSHFLHCCMVLLRYC